MKKRRFYVGKIPFSPTKHKQFDYDMGHEFQGYENEKPYSLPLEWRDNKSFSAHIEFTGYGRGRSSAVFNATLRLVLCSDIIYSEKLEGCEVNIFMSDMNEIIKKSDIYKGVTGRLGLAFCKKGSNYGLCLFEEEE